MENPAVAEESGELTVDRRLGTGSAGGVREHTPTRPSDAVASAARSSGSMVRGSSTGVAGFASPPRCGEGASTRERGSWGSADAKDGDSCTCAIQPQASDRLTMQPSAASLLSRGSAFGNWLTLAGDIVGCEPLRPSGAGVGAVDELSMAVLVDSCGDAVDGVATQLAALVKPECLRVGPVADAALLALTSGGLGDMLSALRAAIKYTAVCFGVEAALADACLYGLRGCAPVCDDSSDAEGGVGAGFRMTRLAQSVMTHPYATGDCTEFCNSCCVVAAATQRSRVCGC